MFKTAQDENAILTWILRGVGFFVMFIGLFMVFRPIVVFADVLPLFGTMLGAGIGLFAFLGSAVLTIITIPIAWVFVPPALRILLPLVAGSALLFPLEVLPAHKATPS